MEQRTDAPGVGVAVVTGAGSGIGRAVAATLAGDGHRVALCGRRRDRLEATASTLVGEGHTVHAGDLTVVGDVEAVRDAVVAAHGGVDAIVHCAGGLGPPSGDDLAGLEQALLGAFTVNVVSTALLTEALVPHLADGRGRVVAIGSIAGLRPGGATYGTAKAALHGWAFALAARLGPRGITVNVVAPGYIADTDLFDGPLAAEREQRLVGETLVGRAGRPDDVAGLVRYLVGVDAGHVTAQVLQVNGGALPR